jgi:hypothetical protein
MKLALSRRIEENPIRRPRLIQIEAMLEVFGCARRPAEFHE